MKKMFLAAGVMWIMITTAQQRPSTPPSGGTITQQTSASSMQQGATSRASSNGPKPYKEVITDKAISKKGLFTVHKVEDKFYFEMNYDMMGTEILAVTRYAKIAGGVGNYGGELVNQQTLFFEKGPSNNIFLRANILISQAEEHEDIYKAVQNSNLNPIVAAFPIAAYNKDSTGVVIDVTDFFKGDNQVVSLRPNTKRTFNLTALANDRSYIQSINTYPLNTEIRTVKTFNASPAQTNLGAGTQRGGGSFPAASLTGAVTMEINTSLIALPKKPMARRPFDPRVGFFADDFTVYGDDQQKVENKIFAVRWRLEPKEGEEEKWKRGELVEPKKPIVYYIDPATPKKWRKYLKMGVDDWQVAFEAAGFKNAIRGEYWPEDDTTMSLEDARFSVIRYFASDIQNAYGPNVHDPRSGEILESHIGWYHNVMELLHNWYFIQTAAVDPKARKMKFDDDLMGELIRFVSSHEVGHTIGLRHNMGSSSKTPVEKLRDKNWVEANGHTASIMDYARFNYVAQPEDNISQKGLFPRIGDYDKWAVRWGYGYIPGDTEEEVKKNSNKLIIDALAKNPRVWFGTESNPWDPRSQTEDLGDNSVKASEYGIKNLQRIVKNLPEWTKEEADVYDNLETMYGQVVSQFRRYIGHVTKNVGGVYETPKSIEQAGPVYEVTPKAIQRDAVKFLIKQVFETPQWLVVTEMWDKFNNPVSANPVISLQESALNNLLSNDRLSRLEVCVARYGNEKALSALDVLSDVQSALFAELTTKKAIDQYRRFLQKAYVTRLSNMIEAPQPSASEIAPGIRISFGVDVNKTDLPAIARAQLTQLRAQVNAAIVGTTDKMSRIHLQDLAEKIRKALEGKK